MALTYIRDDNRPWRISRYDFGADVAERYSYPKGSWVRDEDLYDITIGKYWEFEEISEEEGLALIARYAAERNASQPDASASRKPQLWGEPQWKRFFRRQSGLGQGKAYGK